MSGKGKNPFIITFGKKPIEYIHRPLQTDEILDMFTEDPITNQVFIICGPRGSGKTVMLADIGNRLEKNPEWIVIRCAPTSNILPMIAEGLEQSLLKRKISVDASLSIPAVGSVRLQQNESHTSAPFRIEKALRALAKRKKKLLITIDEVTNTPQMQDFASNLQIWMGQDFPVFFLGTALFERIEELQNVPNLTFLYRAPKVFLTPLDLVSIARAYQKALGVSEEQSKVLSKLTLGYSFAFQSLGYTYWNAMPVENLDSILPDYDAMLANGAYSKMWQEMSEGDHRLCKAIADAPSDKVKDVRALLESGDSNRFNQQRIRLRNKGIVDVSQRGRIAFQLPRFDVFVYNAVDLYGI